jgi:glycosyltransferase involved in cell wall biosynthesis
MATITVGVPVYNGADYLARSLECLRTQRFHDIDILISDNASTDDTARIAQEFCARDARFRYMRQSENIGPVANFLSVLEAAKTPLFLWRAADDTSDANYIETLYDLLRTHPDKDMAVARIVSRYPDGSLASEHRVSAWTEHGGAFGRAAQLYCSHHANWIYGLFRTEAMVPVLNEVLARYPFVWGWDNVAMFPFLFDRRVMGTNATAFYQHLPFKGERKRGAARAARNDEKIAAGRAFMAFAHAHVDRVIANPAERVFYHALVAAWGHKRAVSWLKIARRGIARRMGGSRP